MIPQPQAAISPAIKARDHKGASSDGDGDGAILVPMVSHSLRGEGFDASEDGTGRGTPLVPVGVTIHGTDPTVQKVASLDETAQCLRARTPGNIDNSSTTVVMQPVSFAIQAGALRTNPASGPDGVGVQADHAYTLEARAEVQAVAFAENSRGEVRLEGGDGQRCGALSAGGGKPGQGAPMIATAQTVGAMSASGATERKHGFGWGQQDWESGYCQPDAHTKVRRLTPTECARLQGFPDDYLDIAYRGKPAADGPKYKALGNSWAVPCARWIGERIQAVEAIHAARRDAA